MRIRIGERREDLVETSAAPDRTPEVTRARTKLVAAVLGVSAVAVATAAFASSAAPRAHVPAWLVLFGASSLALALFGWMLRRARPRHLARWVLGGAALLRLAALFAPVSLSEDVHRYVWDGALVASGADPFEARPRALVGQPGLDAALLSSLNSPDYFSVYPPLSQLAFAVGGAAHRTGLDGALTLRALFAGADLAAVALLLALLARLERPRWWALAYAWNPLVYWEVAGAGHTEALMVPLVLLGVLAALDARPAKAGAWLGLAASAKLSALVLAPLLAVYLARRLGAKRAAPFALAAPTIVAVGFVPFASPTLLPHVGESLALYAETFSFNAPIYYGLRHLFGYREGWSLSRDGTVMPILTAATLIWIAALALRRHATRADVVAGLAWTFLGYLLLSRVVHPWYLLPALALGVAAGRWAIVAMSLLVPLSYLRYHPLGYEAPWVMAIELLPLAVALALLGRQRVAPRRGVEDAQAARTPTA